MRELSHLKVEWVGFPEQSRHEIHQGRCGGLVSEEASDFPPEWFDQAVVAEILSDRIKHLVVGAIQKIEE